MARLDDGLDRAASYQGRGWVETGLTVSKLTPLDVYGEAGLRLAPNLGAFVRGDWMPSQKDSWSAVAGVRFRF